ncbi:podocan-like [Paramacrobiotus metropolitanus]|uniref:podocan-like n=1 Tax=Paramacrobiotus metropolitanus TaxID=2943436 RepID=UPI00244584E5|nr:podocan-like [Paramacrobiotus metropolitanus]
MLWLYRKSFDYLPFTLCLNAPLLSILISSALSQCPTLQSGKCFVDCTNSDIYHIACEDARGIELYTDLLVYSQSSQQILLSLWSSPLDQLPSTILEPVANKMQSLELDNWVRLKLFPELHDQYKLKSLRIMNSPRLMEMPLEMLPPQIESIAFYRVGITALFHDFDEVPALPAVNEFIFDGGTLQYIQKQYFTVFPNLTTIKIRGTEFTMGELSREMIITLRPLKKLHIIGNNFRTVPFSNRERMLEGTIIFAYLDQGADMDFSGNHLPVSRMAAVNFEGIRNTRVLSLRDNRFDDYIFTSRLFHNFTNLETLDLTHTFMLKSVASFSGLPKLRALRIAGNEFEELIVSDIFQNSQSVNLELLDLSDNSLVTLPRGVQRVVGNLRVLNLAGNKFHIPSVTDNAEKIHATQFTIFPKLQTLDLSRNRLTSFTATFLNHVQTLTTLNLGCNRFDAIRKEFFIGLPLSLKVLNLTMCYNETRLAVDVDMDAFSTLPRNLSTLILAQSQYSNTIFSRFVLANIPKLRELDLSYNLITLIPKNSSVLAPLLFLRTLKLRANKLQTLGNGRLATLQFLVELDVSRNALVSIGQDDFKGLSNLRTLALAGNQIMDVDTGSFKPLLSLESLYYGENRFTDFDKIFSGGATVGRQLRHLGLQELPIDCVPASLLIRLPRLKWLYLNSSRAVNFETGSFRQLNNFSKNTPYKLFAFRKPNLHDIGCVSYESFEEVYSRPAKFIVADQSNLVPQHMVVRFPRCHMDIPRRLKFYTSQVLCQT